MDFFLSNKLFELLFWSLLTASAGAMASCETIVSDNISSPPGLSDVTASTNHAALLAVVK